MSFSASGGASRRLVLGGSPPCQLCPACFSQPAQAQALTASTRGGFSFVAVGDTRPMMYLPENAGKPDLVKLFVEMFGLVMPEKVAEEVVEKYVKLIFDPDTKELNRNHHAVHDQDRSHDAEGGQGMGHRGFRRGHKTSAGRPPHNVPSAGRRLGDARNRQGRQQRAREICGQQRRRCLVGQPGPLHRRQSVLEAGERHHADAIAARR